MGVGGYLILCPFSRDYGNSNDHTKGEERGRAPGTSLGGKPCIACGDASVFEQKIV